MAGVAETWEEACVGEVSASIALSASDIEVICPASAAADATGDVSGKGWELPVPGVVRRISFGVYISVILRN